MKTAPIITDIKSARKFLKKLADALRAKNLIEFNISMDREVLPNEDDEPGGWRSYKQGNTRIAIEIEYAHQNNHNDQQNRSATD